MKEKFEKPLKKLGSAILVLLFVATFGLVVANASKTEKSRTCAGVDIEIDESGGSFFIDQQDVNAVLGRLDPDTFYGAQIAKVDLNAVELALESLDHAQEAEVWFGPGGTMQVNLTQRAPLVRVIHNDAVSYYIDVNGKKMPLSRKFTSRVPVVSGLPVWAAEPGEGCLATESEEALDLSCRMFREVLEFSKWLDNDPFWSAMVEQIHVTERDVQSADENSDQLISREGINIGKESRSYVCEFELVPKVGQQLIVLGTLADFETKLDKLMTFYTEGMNYTGWDQYSRINLSFENQVVVTEKK